MHLHVGEPIFVRARSIWEAGERGSINLQRPILHTPDKERKYRRRGRIND